MTIQLQRAVTCLGITGLLLIAGQMQQSQAQTRILDAGKLPNDVRLQPPKDLNGYHPFVPPKSLEEWEIRAEKLQRRVLVATGLWPMPVKTPLNAQVYGKLKRDDFTVEKVHFESFPGNYVTGMIFRPAQTKGKMPGVLCPHGHWSGGRKYDHGPVTIKKLIVEGQERFLKSGRMHIFARCAQMARIGCVVFAIDMVGYADNNQISYQVAHRYSKIRPEFETKQNWGFFSVQAELRQQSIMGLQTWNCIRAIDFLCEQPDVDTSRLGVTGCSGGGTQTIMAAAVDPRLIVAFPQGMVSTAMQGGCTCENCSLLRVGHGNVELAALFAPKPQAMTSANDWTKEMESKGFPELQKLYELYGKKSLVDMRNMNQFPHNYNYVTRAYMYQWFNKHLKLGLKTPILEKDFEPPTMEELKVWDAEHPEPEGGPKHERALLAYMDKQSNKQIEALTPTDKDSLEQYRKIVGGAVEIIIGRQAPADDELKRIESWKKEHDDYFEFGDLLRDKKHQEEIPIVSFYPKKQQWNRQVVLWIDGTGKAGMYGDDGQPIAAIQHLLEKGTAVLGADLLFQGEFTPDGKPEMENRVVTNPREFAGYTYTYNHTLFAKRVHDILKLVTFARTHKYMPETIRIVGVNGAGPLVAAARALAGGQLDKAVVDTDRFRFTDLKSYKDANFLPGIVKYGGLAGLHALSAPEPLYLIGENGDIPEIVQATYAASGSKGNIKSVKGSAQDALSTALDWLVLE